MESNACSMLLYWHAFFPITGSRLSEYALFAATLCAKGSSDRGCLQRVQNIVEERRTLRLRQALLESKGVAAH